MAVAVIGGLITSTLLTLVVVPVAYSLLDQLAERVTGKRRGAVVAVEGAPAPPTPVLAPPAEGDEREPEAHRRSSLQ